jgi:cytochrome d ubiquinol oxidase subunit II
MTSILTSLPVAASVNGFINPVQMDPSPLQILWFLLIGVLLIGYFILDGFDLGSGALYPFIAKTDAEKALVRRSIGPLWDGNEVWLLTGGGALFAAFAPAYATSFSGFYLAIMLVLFGLIARAIAIEFRALDGKLGKVYDIMFFIGSGLPALLFGVAVGNVLEGIPLDAAGNYIGIPLFGLLRPFPLVCGVVGLAVMLLQGASWQALKQPVGSAVRERAVRLRSTFLIIALAAFIVASVLYLIWPLGYSTGEGLLLVLRFVFVAVLLVGFIATFVTHSKGNDLLTFVCASIAPVALIGLTAASLFPYLIPSISTGPSITVASAGGSDLALTAMTIIACIGVPLVLVYHVIIYRTFRGRLKEEEAAEY